MTGPTGEPSLGEMFNLTKTAAPSPASSPGPQPTPGAVEENRRRTAATQSRRTQGTGRKVDRPRAVRAVPDAISDPGMRSSRDGEDPQTPGRATASSPTSPHPATHARVTPATSTTAGVGGRASIMLYTTPTVEQAMREEAAKTSLTYGQLTLICVESTLDRIRETFAARAGVTSRLFSTNYRHRAREDAEKRTAGLNLHIARSDLEIIDGLWPDMPGCKSRNDLLSTACSLHLVQQTDT